MLKVAVIIFNHCL